MTGFWGGVKYSAGDRVPLRRERCQSRPVNANGGTHTCRQHLTHVADHRCICGIRWGANGRVLTPVTA